ncbi:MAG TPA: LTA synthase family protein, partial [Arachidicoccus sp.]|nr:LTA synthase family protein [Arachidicoccus sp.]
QHSKVTFDKDEVQKNYPLMADFLAVKHPDLKSLNYERIITPDTPNTTPPNIVVVICESFSYVKSSMSGNELNPTPYFDSLSKEGIFFTRCFSPSVGTARGVWAVITGTPDVERSSTSSRNPGAVNQHTIINAFKGYDKSYYIGGSLSWANIRGLLENNIPGLKTIEQPDYEAPKINVWGVSDKHVFERANKDFSKATKPFFAVIQTADNHRPYTIPDEDKAQFKLVHYSQKEVLENGFTSLDELNAFRYTDFCYRHFIESAKKEAYFKNTIFVFVGDHGTKGDASKYYPDAWTNGSLVNMHVPLLFYAPALFPPETLNSFASQVDLLPTVAGLAKVNYKNTTIGRDLLSPDLRAHPERDGTFIYDPSNITIGYMHDSIYYFYNLTGNQPAKTFNMYNNNPVHLTDSAGHYYRTMTNAIYQTTKYLLLNNKVH